MTPSLALPGAEERRGSCSALDGLMSTCNRPCQTFGQISLWRCAVFITFDLIKGYHFKSLRSGANVSHFLYWLSR